MNVAPFLTTQAAKSHIILGLNNRNPQYHDIHRCNIKTGELTKAVKLTGIGATAGAKAAIEAAGGSLA